MTNREDCPFCNFNEEQDRIISVGKFSTSVLSNPRLTKGHILVMPNRHVELPTELSDEEIVDIFREIKRLEIRLLAGFAYGVDLWQKTRPEMPEGTNHKVDHVHFHVLPIGKGDEMYDRSLTWTGDRFTELSAEERDKMIELLKD